MHYGFIRHALDDLAVKCRKIDMEMDYPMQCDKGSNRVTTKVQQEGIILYWPLLLGKQGHLTEGFSSVLLVQCLHVS